VSFYLSIRFVSVYLIIIQFSQTFHLSDMFE